MKRILTSALILALSIGAAQAQQNNHGKGEGPKKEHRGHQMDKRGGGFEKLNLTADQKTKMKSLHEQFKKESDDLKAQESTLTAAQMKEKRQALHEKHQAQMEAILTKEQKDQLAQLKADHKGFDRGPRDGAARFDSTRRGNFDRARGDRGRGFERDGDFAKELNLTADQQSKLQQIRTDFRSKMEALKSDNSLTQEQKRTKFRELAQAQQEQMKKVLTKEQIEKMQSLRKERSARNTK